jgi:cyclic-di-GMP phosphodiesterase TipF (flagellum assembly factor)
MRFSVHVLLNLIYVVPALAFGMGWVAAPEQLQPLSQPTLGLLILALGLGAHGAIAASLVTRRWGGLAERLGAQLEDALSEQRRLEGEINNLRVALVDVREQPQEDVGRVVAEVKVLQSLIGQLYSARTGALSPKEAPSSETKSQSPPRATSPGAYATVPSAGTRSGDLDPAQILDLVREGLRENGVELALQPIVSLPQRKRRHFECFSRIRARDGRVIVPEQYIEIAEQNGLITAIDNLLLLRCLQTLRRIRKGNANVNFFLNISPHTLADRGFFREFIGLMTQNADLAPALVFELPQRALIEADANLGRDLERLAQMGFRFSLDQVNDLNLNAAQLASAHFRFLKLDAQRLLRAQREGLLGGDAKQFKKLLDSYGIDLVVERIETEAMLLELLDLQIDYGQGYLFGEPRFAKYDSSVAVTQ